MSNRKRVKVNQNLSQRMCQPSSTVLKRLVNWFLRRLLVMSRRARLSRSGFVLPTVIMVSVVVLLMTTAILLRSFDRAKNASNVRVNQAVINAAAPAIDRARAKIDALFNEPTLPRLTPTDIDLYSAIKTNPQYTFGDETRLKLTQEFNQKLGFQGNTPTLEDDETLTTAWKFPVDTDNNGRYDSYTLYGIYFRNPSRAATGSDVGKFDRARNPLEARTSPMDEGGISEQCTNALGTSASPVGDSSWYKSYGKLKKSLFAFVATIPNTDRSDDKYEPYKGSKGFSALEFQQDRSLIPLNNNAVWFQDDLELTPSTPFRLNGRVQTNANLLVGGHKNAYVQFYQVSSKSSCFYQQENAKITVGGNVGTGDVTDTTDQATGSVNDRTGAGTVAVDLYSNYPDGRNPSFSYIGGTNKSTNSTGGSQIAYNDAAYNQRIALMKQTALSAYYCREAGIACSEINPPLKNTVLAITQYPEDVKNRFASRVNANYSLNTYGVLAEEIEIYLKNRTRRVPYAEILAPDGTQAKEPYDSPGTGIDINVFSDSSSPIEPPTDWRKPLDSQNQLTNTNPFIRLELSQLQATWPKQQRQDGKETLLGDRVLTGNNLPALWKKGDEYVTGEEPQLLGEGINWTKPNAQPRYRTTQVQKINDLGISERDGFWEEAAAKNPKAPSNNPLANFGGLRVIAGAGVYYNSSSNYEALSTPSFISAPISLDSGGSIPNIPPLLGETTTASYTLVWPDTMPMKGGADDKNTPKLDESTAPPDLRMRATAVYHYKQSSGINQTPIACVSSYYDPTNAATAQNGQYGTNNHFPWGSGGTNLPQNPDISPTATVTPTAGSGRSNNGVVYPAPYTSDAARSSAIATYRSELKAQAQMMFPNGRIVNEPLQKALRKLSSNGALADYTKPLSLSENSAIDTAICAIKILDATLLPSTTPVIPHGAIKEASFLDAREVKALDKASPALNGSDSSSQPEVSSTTYDINKNYDLALEQRQPLEIRVTEINLSTDDTRGITRKTIVTNGATDNAQGTNNTIATNEYILPNSGIIYASRDDALPDLSNTSDAGKLLSPTDFRLDPTRRPNGIRLINGSNLSRTTDNTDREAEKGLTLVTNLPVYVKGNFNLHRQPGGSTDIEEFTEKLVSNWDNFYTRIATPDPNFACRPGKTGCPTISPNSSGDTWRAATVISDAVTLLSDFQDGFRDQGDFDLRNNAGSSAAQIRQRNGFWDNSFVTSAVWWDTNSSSNPYPAEKTTDSYVGSYLTNGVTPIQRRTNFSEYVMEICRKLPVSACSPSDWEVGTSNSSTTPGTTPGGGTAGRSITAGGTTGAPTAGAPTGASALIGTPTNQLLAGTTAKPPIDPADQRYARRVAFLRDPSSGVLTLKTLPTGEVTPTPLGINRSGKVDAFSYDKPNIIPNLANNALWFRTTTNARSKPFCNGNNDPAGSGCTSDDRSYAANNLLYYDGNNTRLFSPPTVDIPGVPSLNLPAESPASSYTICTQQSSSKKYSVGSGTNKPELGQCSSEPGNPMAQIQAALQGFMKLQPDDNLNNNSIIRRPQPTPLAQTFAASPGTTTAFTSNPLNPSQPVVNVIDITGDFTTPCPPRSQTLKSSATITTINLAGNDNSIFVLRKNSDLNFGSPATANACPVTLNLNGVDPNNVFWAINGNVQWNKPAATVAGNFITKSTVTPNLQRENVIFQGGGRLLGFSGFPLDQSFTAIASKEQPSLVPVLQIHSPDGVPSGGGNLDQGSGQFQKQWIQQAKTDTTFNAAFVSGNSPSRPLEQPAGLDNFVRFLEQWQGKTTNIKGNFIQFERSAYATAPFAPIRSDNITKNDGSLSLFGYSPTKYPVDSTTADTMPYYTAPTRQWGFDVGLLSQSPDLFAQKFTQQPVAPPNEFFREVGRNDSWIQTLLCAADASDRVGGRAATYTQYTVTDKNQRPSTCQADVANYPTNETKEGD